MRNSILIIILFLSATILFSCQNEAENKTAQSSVLIINAIIDKEHKSELNEYLTQMMQIFKAYNGTPIGRYKTTEKLMGSQAPEMIAMISFEDTETIKRMINDKKFKELSEIREQVFSGLNIVICTELE